MGSEFATCGHFHQLVNALTRLALFPLVQPCLTGEGTEILGGRVARKWQSWGWNHTLYIPVIFPTSCDTLRTGFDWVSKGVHVSSEYLGRGGGVGDPRAGTLHKQGRSPTGRGPGFFPLQHTGCASLSPGYCQSEHPTLVPRGGVQKTTQAVLNQLA